MRRQMNNTAFNALAGMARVVALLLLFGSWVPAVQAAQVARACMKPDCPIGMSASEMPCTSLDERADGHRGCMHAAMDAAVPCLTRLQRAPAKEQLPSAAVPIGFAPAVQIAAFARPPKTIDRVAPIIRSRRRNASLAVLHCSFQR